MSTINKSFSNGEIIIKEGDSGNTFFKLLEGKAEVYQNYGKADEVKIADLEEGQYFGEMAVIENYPRSGTVIAAGDVQVDEIAAEELNEYITENPNNILEIMKLLGSRIKTMTESYNEAKKVLDDVRKVNSSSHYDSFFAKMAQQSIYLTAKNFRLERPSAESLREAEKAVSGLKNDNNTTYPYGTIIYKQGEVGKCMYIVHAGTVNIFTNYGADNEIKLASIEPVGCFGELGMLTGEARNETAVVEANDTQVEIIHPEDLEGIFKSSPAKIDMILKNLSYRLRNTTYEYYKACKEIYESSRDND